jgi:hypothetical protein
LSWARENWGVRKNRGTSSRKKMKRYVPAGIPAAALPLKPLRKSARDIGRVLLILYLLTNKNRSAGPIPERKNKHYGKQGEKKATEGVYYESARTVPARPVSRFLETSTFIILTLHEQ